MGVDANGSALGASAALQQLSAIGIVELLEHDGRPTFILDLDARLDDTHWEPVFCNASLRSSMELQEVVLGKVDYPLECGLQESRTHSEFKEWALSSTSYVISSDGNSPSFLYCGVVWTTFVLRERWRLISGNQVKRMGSAFTVPAGTPSHINGSITATQNKSYPSQAIPGLTPAVQPQLGGGRPAAWTELLPSSQHTQLFMSIDWSATTLGPLESWSYHLRQMTLLLMSDPRPAAMYWGAEKIIMYNEPYIIVAARKHPAMMGRTFEQAWPEVSDVFVFAAELTGRATTSENTMFFIERHGYLEESFFSWSMIPLRGQIGNIEGFYNPAFETTRQTISDRRTKTLISVASATDMLSFWSYVLQGLEPNHLDVPFAMLYSLSQNLESDKASGPILAILQGTLGVPKDHKSAPDGVDFEHSKEGFIPYFRKAMHAGDPLLLQKRDGDLPEDLTTGIRWRGYGEPSAAVIFPLLAGTQTIGFLLIGLNSRRAYDDDYQRFVKLLSGQLSTSLNSAVLMEQAVLNQAELSKQLALRTREVEESQKRFARIIELMPVGFSSCDSDGTLIFSNNAFFDITGHLRGDDDPMSWIKTIVEEDLPIFEGAWHTLMVEQKSLDCHLRLKKKFRALNDVKGDADHCTTVLVHAYPEISDEDGSTVGITSMLTDISQLVYLEAMQKERAEEALERAKLAEKLALRTQEAANSESKFKALAELTPVGLFYMDQAGKIIFANESWYEITGYDRALESSTSFMDVVLEEDVALMRTEWSNLAVARIPRTFEIRIKKKWYDKTSGKSTPTWMLVSASQEQNEDGSLKSVMGCLIDISLQKQAQEHALERAALSEELIRRTQEAAESEKKFKQMAELAPCGMFYMSADGLVIWANSQWYEMTGHGRAPEDHYPLSFVNFIAEDDQPLLFREWDKLTIAKMETRFEIRVRRKWINNTSDKPTEETAWLLAMAFPEIANDGSVKSVMGCTADISQLKWAESVQTRSRIDAEEAKRQQEQFMDITSHEMRNPLSAILQCADDISTSMSNYKLAPDKSTVMSEDFVHGILEAAQIISLCSQHQTRIINDILTLSKLNSDMLLVTPVIVQPAAVVQRILKMFQGELQSHDIKMHFLLQPSYEECDIDWAFCDPSRLTQVFINVLTNAIKFTRSEAERQITVSLGASVSEPPKDRDKRVQWFPSQEVDSRKDLVLGPDWGEGEPVYLYFAVTDTGRGLSTEEKTRLFHRFSQASPRTHVQYGGSGLGLFISRKLTELQGGVIGVVSEAGKGSTFAFYIKGRKATAPADANDAQTHPIAESAFSISPTNQQINLSKATNHPTYPPMDKESRKEEGVKNHIVLLVEDNLVNQKVLSKQLKRVGCTVYVANHGQEALEVLQRTKLWKDSSSDDDIDIVLMDLEMPVMDGLTCARKIRELKSQGSILRHIPIIAVTANARMEQIDTAIAAGMDDVMPKPFQIAELIPKIRRLIAKQWQ